VEKTSLYGSVLAADLTFRAPEKDVLKAALPYGTVIYLLNSGGLSLGIVPLSQAANNPIIAINAINPKSLNVFFIKLSFCYLISLNTVVDSFF